MLLFSLNSALDQRRAAVWTPCARKLSGHQYGFGLLQLTLNNSVFSIAVENDTAGETLW